MIPVSLIPWIGREAGNVYVTGAIMFGSGFAYLAFRFGRLTTNAASRQLLFASIIYLPTIFILLLLDPR